MLNKTIILFFCAVISLNAQESVIKLSYNDFLYEDYTQIHLNDNRVVYHYQENIDSKKSVGKALFLSLFVPGAGEYYADETFYTKIFFGIEVAAIGSLLLTDYIYRSKLDDSRIFATSHAGINPSGKDNDYWRVVGKYDDIFLHNQQRLRERAIGDLIPENELNNWRWDTHKNRLKYDKKRLDAQLIRDSEAFIITAIFVNHLVSAINAVRLTRKFNKRLASYGLKYNMVFKTRNQSDRYVGLSFSKAF